MNAPYWDIWNRISDIQEIVNDIENEVDFDERSRYYQDLLEQEAELFFALNTYEEEGS